MHLRFISCIVAVLLWVGGSAGAVMLTAEIRDASGDPNALTVADTALDVPFTFEIQVASNFDMVNLELRVQTLTGGGIFALNSRTFDADAGWGYYPLAFTAPDSLTGSPGGISSQKIGCLSVGSFVPAGTSRYATIDAFVKAGTPAGSYRLNLASIMAGNTSYQDVIGSAGQAYVVTVLPEPASLLLLAGAGLLIGRRRGGKSR